MVVVVVVVVVIIVVVVVAMAIVVYNIKVIHLFKLAESHRGFYLCPP